MKDFEHADNQTLVEMTTRRNLIAPTQLKQVS